MKALLQKSVTLRSFLRSASHACRVVQGDESLEQKLACLADETVSYALDHTFLIPSHPADGFQPLPRSPWNSERNVSHIEVVDHVIQRLVLRKRSLDWKYADILALGFQEATPESTGHRLTHSNGIMWYHPNTLVATLKGPVWESLHELMGDDLMIHLLLNYSIFVQLKDANDSYMQVRRYLQESY
ncbi:hypothetical protein PsorP6_000360 [Peronosclerospora sorghi]|uniref:Uncharacterized protein n=1 Tax=Peronosclerospora sorghi TaxID=230839 RepID=A0ACC0WT49_9STRA|nr:hypothetical protein PsorP6_000360 [Peronosclerospora sorghi]